MKSYFSYMVDVAVIFGADRKAAEEQLREVLLMEIELAKVPNNLLITMYLVMYYS